MDPAMMNDWRVQLLGGLITVLVAIVSAAVPVLVSAILRYIERRLHIDISDAQERAIQAAAADGVAWAEEQSRKAAKAHGAPWPSDQKLAMAKTVARDVLARRGHPNLGTLPADVAIEQAVEATVNRTLRPG